MPFFAVEFIPSTDLPQHLGQLRLFAEAWANPGGELEIHWWTPYGLVYALLAIPWLFLSPVVAGKAGVLLIVLLQVAALHLLAAKYDRPVAGAILASAFVFHDQLYWGFLNFLLGGVVFFGWFELTRRPEDEERVGWRSSLWFLGVAGLLYLAHALWFALGALWFVVEAAISRRSLRSVAWRAAGLAPIVAVAAWWFVFFRSTNFATPPVWAAGPLARLHPQLFTLAGLGGIQHPIEALVVLGAVVWAVAAIVARRKQRVLGCDPHLAALAVMCLGLYLVLPDKFSNTIRFSTRWLPFAMMAALLAVGHPSVRRGIGRAVAIVLLATLMVVTTAFWRGFESEELAGLPESLAALPDEPRVMGLSYLEKSRFVNGQPFIQIFAWAQAVHGGELSFSFGYFAPSLVVYKDDGRVQWSWGLEWFPKAVRRSDFQYFDFALVGGDEEAHERMRRVPELVPIVDEGLWRLYRVEPRHEPAPEI